MLSGGAALVFDLILGSAASNVVVATTLSVGDTVTCCVVKSSTGDGIAVFVTTEGKGSFVLTAADETADLVPSSLLYLLSDNAGANQTAGSVKNFRLIHEPLSDARALAAVG